VTHAKQRYLDPRASAASGAPSACSRIIDAMGRKLGLSPDKVVMTIEQHANTSAASIPLALEAAGR